MSTPTARTVRRFDSRLCLGLLRDWAAAAEAWWYPIPGHADLGCYGSGYNSWGVQTNQKYLSAMAVLAELGEAIDADVRDHARERALAALRFSLRSHQSGDLTCTDGTKWGHTWISALGVERMMHGVQLLEPHFTVDDHRRLRAMLISEAEWLCHHLVRGKEQGVVAGLWGAEGRNVPESNIWNGALLWRTAERCPDHPDTAAWRERAHQYFINGVSVPADETDDRVVAGKPISERYVGANFFPNYALDHHAYLNVGYMVICLSNAAMLHFDLKARGDAVPESLYHHEADLWGLVRRLVFGDGRLARIGGDSRVRYTYCQEYLLPSLVFAADCFEEPHAEHLLAGQVDLIRQEAAFNGDGSFYGARLASLAERSPYYYTRLEADRACALGQVVAYTAQVGLPNQSQGEGAFEASAAGGWAEPEHGAAMHRSPTRLASFSWRAYGLTQGMCQPPDDGHLAEWTQNLAGWVRFLGEGGKRELRDQRVISFDGGFATWGSVTEGVGVTLAEGWKAPACAINQLAFVALPDEHTVVGLQLVRALDHRTYLKEAWGLNLNLPNDLLNGFRRRLVTEGGNVTLESPPAADEVRALPGRWALLADRVGVVGVYGGARLEVHRRVARQGGPYDSLYVERLGLGGSVGTRALEPSSIVVDVGWAVCSSTDAAATQRLSETAEAIDGLPGDARGVMITGRDGRRYGVLANFGAAPLDATSRLGDEPADWLVGAAELAAGQVAVARW